MGIMKLGEEALGAFAADKALEAVDPNAGFLAKAAAAVAGFEGAGAISDHFSEGQQAEPAAQDEQVQPEAIEPTDDSTDNA